MRIKRPIRLAQQPALPIRILFAELRLSTIEPALPLHIYVLQHVRRNAGIGSDKTPALFIDIPFLLNVNDVANLSRPNNIPHRQRIRLRTVLRSHLHHLFRSFYDIAGRFCLGEHIGKRFFDVTILARLYHVGAQLRMLEISTRDHYAVNIFPRKHVLGVLIHLRLKLESLFHLRGTPLSRPIPEIAYGHYFDWNLRGREVRHMYKSLAPVPASQLSQPDTIVCSYYSGVRMRINAGSEQHSTSPF